jgi:hypothetical protein
MWAPSRRSDPERRYIIEECWSVDEFSPVRQGLLA